MANIQLSDDGTMDTVLICADCSEEFRFNFDPTNCAECEETDAAECTHYDYDDFVADCITEIEDEHECEASDPALCS